MKTRKFKTKKSNKIARNLWILLLLAILVLLLFSCQAQDGVNAQQRTTVVFVDKTNSTTPNPYLKEKNTSFLRKIVKENAFISGDIIIVSFIYENTANATNKQIFLYHPPKAPSRKMSPNEARIAQVKYDKRLRDYKKNFTESIIAKALA